MGNTVPEIRTQRLVIEDSQGRGRIVLELNPGDDQNPAFSLRDVHGVERIRAELNGRCGDMGGIWATFTVGAGPETVVEGQQIDITEPMVSLSASRNGAQISTGEGVESKASLTYVAKDGASVRVGGTVITSEGLQKQRQQEAAHA